MIIKMTVSDNDFGFVMTNLCMALKNGCPEIGTEEEKAINYIKNSRRWNQLYHEDFLPQTEKNFIIDMITKKFYDIIKTNDENTQEYLKRNFRCTFVDYIDGKWENGEAYYFIPKSYSAKFINM